jgi:Icc-related predicted phosphoesterase
VDITCVSDLHGFYPKLEGGDLLIVAGDSTATGDSSEQLECLSWIQNSKHKKKVIIAGNHDSWMLPLKHDHFKGWNITYLCDSGTEFEGLKIWGSPWTHLFPGVNPHCTAFMIQEKKLAAKWALIPDNVDILVTHSPPHGVLDEVRRYSHSEQLGSFSLRKATARIRPKLHVFGHIHGGYGKQVQYWNEEDEVYSGLCVNASIMNECYEPVNKPIRVIL